jgi:transposase
MLPLAVILVLIGFILFQIGRRGWFAGTHPFCRRCEFDLFALPPETRRCPECGGDILADDAIRIGRRRPLRSAMAGGVVFAGAGATLLLVGVFAWLPHADFSRFKTLGMLEAALNDHDDTLRDRSCEELRRRVLRGAMSRTQTAEMAGVILRYQADPAVSWNPDWGDLLQTAHARGLYDSAWWRLYLSQSMQITAEVRPVVRIDDPIPFTFTCRLRAGSDLQELNRAVIVPEVIAAVGVNRSNVHLQPARLDVIPVPLQWTSLWVPAESRGGEWPATLAVTGPQTLELFITIRMVESPGGAGGGGGGSAVAGATGATTHHFRLPFDALPRGSSSIVLRGNPQIDQEMIQAVHYRPPRNIATDGTIRAAAGSALGNLWIAGPPLPAAFRIVLRQGGREWPLARVLVRPNDAATESLSLPVNIPPPGAGAAEIVCLPDPTLATGSVDLLEVWSGRWVQQVTFSAGGG